MWPKEADWPNFAATKILTETENSTFQKFILEKGFLKILCSSVALTYKPIVINIGTL